MKLTQVVASAAGAVVAAIIASSFGVTGTVIGVAVGSVVATSASALVTKSLERTTPVVRQVVIDQNPLLRKFGGTSAAGRVARTRTRRRPSTDAGEHAGEHEPEPGGPDRRDGAGGQTPDGRAEAEPSPGERHPRGGWGSFPRWAVTGLAAAVLALGVVTVVELVVGKPLSSLLGGSNVPGGTTIGHALGGSSSTTSSTSTTTSTTSTTSSSTTSTTSTTPSTSSTSTTSSSTTSTTSPTSSPSTTTASPSSTTSTTTSTTASTTASPSATPTKDPSTPSSTTGPGTPAS